jgi:hypothetical protein
MALCMRCARTNEEGQGDGIQGNPVMHHSRQRTFRFLWDSSRRFRSAMLASDSGKAMRELKVIEPHWITCTYADNFPQSVRADKGQPIIAPSI